MSAQVPEWGGPWGGQRRLGEYLGGTQGALGSEVETGSTEAGEHISGERSESGQDK